MLIFLMLHGSLHGASYRTQKPIRKVDNANDISKNQNSTQIATDCSHSLSFAAMRTTVFVVAFYTLYLNDSEMFSYDQR